VPAPRSSLLVSGGLWPSLLIAEELVKVGLSRTVAPYLVRSNAIKKSSGAQMGYRPTIEEQYNSLIVQKIEVFPPKKITLIDDVLTKGRASFACVLRLSEVFPNSEIRVFAPMRTQGLIEDIDKFIDSATGEITYDGHGDVNRQP
jgi:hypothetical protein